MKYLEQLHWWPKRSGYCNIFSNFRTLWIAKILFTLHMETMEVNKPKELIIVWTKIWTKIAILYRLSLRMNFYNHHIRSIFKSHSISVTFKFCAVLDAQGILATEFKHASMHKTMLTEQNLKSNTNILTFEYAPNMMIVKVHPQSN